MTYVCLFDHFFPAPSLLATSGKTICARVKTPWPLFLSYVRPYRYFLLVIVLQGNCLILLEL